MRGQARFAAIATEKDLGQEVRQKWDSWRTLGDEEVVRELVVFTDGAATMAKPWPRKVVSAGWSAISLCPARGAGLEGGSYAWLGALYGPVDTDPDGDGHMGAMRPSSPTAELTAMMAALALTLTHSGGHELALQFRSDSS